MKKKEDLESSLVLREQIEQKIFLIEGKRLCWIGI